MTDETTFKDAIPPATAVTGNTDAISVNSRLLPFWRELPSIWFIQFEAVIDPLKTSDDQKYRYLLQQLQSQDLRHITDILRSPPSTNKYEAVKKRLISVYEQSSVQNFQRLVSGLELGDQKPSQLLRQMRDLGTDMITEEGLKVEWLKQMPTNVRAVLAVNSDSSLDTLSTMADKMLEFTPTAVLAPVTTSQHSSQESNTISMLTKQLAELTYKIDEIDRRHRSRSHTRSQSYGRANSRSRSRSDRNYHNKRTQNRQFKAPANGICYYHNKFGKEAHRCKTPCNWKPSEN